ncbi:MAG TPA: class I adenylate-forming enzyme family protein, partial [Candidatus Saccharimonadales bacterium]|nr:class I adenylate-forming enzyme family protein [Candidatus Saccharimonadales bacterium]
MSREYLTDYLARNARDYADKPAVIFENRSINWSQLWEQTTSPAAYITERLASNKQEVIALMLPNSIEFVIAYLAIVRSGHIVMPIDPAYKSLELDNMIDQLPPALIITDKNYFGRFNASHQKSAVLIDKLHNYRGDTEPAVKLPAADQIVSLTFTSGTTGNPKTVPYTHANHIWNIEVCSQAWDWTHKDSLLVNVPLSHFNGVVMALSGAVYHGNTIYLHRWFDEHATLETLASGKVTMFNHAASAYVKLTALPKAHFDLSNVRLCTSGAAALPPTVWRQFKDRYGIEILETYGSSETGRIAGNRLDERVLGSPGRPFAGVEIRLNKENEIEVRSGGVFPGYYGNPQATARGRTSDGFWRTGDTAEIKDGYIYLRGRKQERIRRFGYTVSPRDVEWALHKHPAIKDVAVIGRQIADDPNDELIYFIVTDLSDQQIKDYCKQNL